MVASKKRLQFTISPREKVSKKFTSAQQSKRAEALNKLKKKNKKRQGKGNKKTSMTAGASKITAKGRGGGGKK